MSHRGPSPSLLSIPLLLLLLLALAQSSLPVDAIYQEQAGTVDWHVSHVGGVSNLIFRDSHALVSTTSNVLASISVTGPQSGDTAWRQVLPSGEALVAFGSYSKSRVISLSATESGIAFARVWSSKDGALVWDAPLTNSEMTGETASHLIDGLSEAKRRVQGHDTVETVRAQPDEFTNADISTIADVNGDEKSDIIAMYKNKVFLLSGANGSLLWSWSKSNFVGLRLAVESGKIAVVGQEKNGAIAVYLVQGKDGKELSNKSLSFASSATKRSVQLLSSTGSLALLNSASSFAIASLFDAAAKETIIDLSKEGVTDASHIESLANVEGAAYVAVYSPSKQVVFEITRSGVKKLNSFTAGKGEDVELAIARDAESKSIEIVRAVLVKGRLTVTGFALSSTSPSTTHVSSQPFVGRGGLKQMWVDSVGGGSKKSPARILIAGVDDSLTLFVGGTAKWSREEALAAMMRLQYVELPAGSNDVDDESSGSYPNFFQRILPQARSVVGGLSSALNPFTAISKAQQMVDRLSGASASGPSKSDSFRETSFARPLAADDVLQQDYFGFRKLLLASTASGKIYALESESGRVVWSKFLRIGSSADDDNEADEQVAPVWRVHVVSHHEAVAIVHDDENATPRRSHLIAFNPVTGDLIKGQSMEVDFVVSTSLVLPFIDSHNRRILLVSSAGGAQVRVFPNTDEVRTIVGNKANDVFFYTVDIADQLLQGFNLRKDGSNLKAVETWSTRFPADQESIVSIAARAPNEVIQSSVRVLGGGDGGYLYKYLNPNLLAVATVRIVNATSNHRVVPSLKRTTDPSVNLYLIDTITGALLDKFVHRGCEGPVTVVQSENSILYHYFNAATHQYEMSVVELYETRDGSSSGSPIGNSGVVPNGGSIFDGLTLASIGSIGRSAVQPFNSLVEPPPQSIQQTFTFKSAIKSLGVTQTRRGITMKEYLIGLPSDQLYALPRMLVDPRRPVGEPTQLDKMEGLIPYSAEIPIDPLRIVTHGHTIGNLHSITSSHALLESTSLVCAYGIDLFCIRVNPSQTFDLLNEDFNSPFLIATVTAVFAAIVWTRRMAKAKELKAAWK